MVKHILVAGQSPCNERNGFIANESEIQLPENPNSHTTNKANYKTNLDEKVRSCTGNSYLSFSSAQQIIQQLLTYPRVVLLPTQVPKFTTLEIATKLNLTPAQLSLLQKSPEFYKRMAKHICLPLASLYCSSALQQPKLNHDGGTHHE